MSKLQVGTKVYLVGGAFTPNLPKAARGEGITEGEIIAAWTEGRELVYRVRVTLEPDADGKIRVELHELVAVGSQLVKFIRTEVAQKAGNLIVRWFRSVFGKKG
jgi:hypothetical protein